MRKLLAGGRPGMHTMLWCFIIELTGIRTEGVTCDWQN